MKEGDKQEYNLSALRMEFFDDDYACGEYARWIMERLLVLCDEENARRIHDAIVDEVIEDVYETSAWQEFGEFSSGDVDLAIGRVLRDRLGLE